MSTDRKLTGKKPRTSKSLRAVARQRLLLVNGLLDEVARNYIARLHREILDLTRALERQPSSPDSRREIKDLEAILKNLGQLHIDPEKGRRKDLKKIDTLIGELQSMIDKW